MDLSLSRRADYVLRAAIFLARSEDPDNFRKVREISEEMDLPERYTPQILGLLLRAGLAESRAGQNGGYRLLRQPTDISLLELVEAGEGQLWPQRCTLSGGPCRWDEMCAVHPAWEQAHRALSEALGKITLSSIAEVDTRLEAGIVPDKTSEHPEPTVRKPRRRPVQGRV